MLLGFGCAFLLVRLHAAEAPDAPSALLLAFWARPTDDPVRLGQQPSLAFAPSTIAGFELGSGIYVSTMRPEDSAAVIRDHEQTTAEQGSA